MTRIGPSSQSWSPPSSRGGGRLAAFSCLVMSKSSLMALAIINKERDWWSGGREITPAVFLWL